jgi:hypothetical protein
MVELPRKTHCFNKVDDRGRRTGGFYWLTRKSFFFAESILVKRELQFEVLKQGLARMMSRR